MQCEHVSGIPFIRYTQNRLQSQKFLQCLGEIKPKNLKLHIFKHFNENFNSFTCVYNFILRHKIKKFYLFIYSARHRVLYHCCPHSFKIDFVNSTMFQHLKLLLVDFTAHALLDSFRSCDMPGNVNVNDLLMNDSFSMRTILVLHHRL